MLSRILSYSVHKLGLEKISRIFLLYAKEPGGYVLDGLTPVHGKDFFVLKIIGPFFNI